MKPTLHILFLCSWFPNRLNQFNGNFIQRHAKAIASQHKVSVLFVTALPELKQPLLIETVRQDDYEAYRVYFKKHWFLPIHWFRRILAYKKALQLIGRFDLVHVNVIYSAGIVALYLRFFCNKQFIITEHWTQFTKPKKDLPWLKRVLIRLIAKRAKMIVPVSNDLATHLKKFGIKNQYKVIPNVVDTTIFKPKENSNQNQKPTFLHISSLNQHQKNIDGILDAFALVAKQTNNFSLRIGGSGNLDWLRNEVCKRNLDSFTTILPALTQQEVAKEMQQADCFVLFSRFETQGCVVAESFACGLPAIVPNLDAVLEYVPKGFGWIVEQGNVAMLEQVILERIGELPISVNKKDELREFALSNFSVKRIASDYNSVYKSALNA